MSSDPISSVCKSYGDCLAHPWFGRRRRDRRHRRRADDPRADREPPRISVEERFDRRLSEVHEASTAGSRGLTAGFSRVSRRRTSDPDRRPAEQARRDRRPDAPEGSGPRSARAGASAAEGAGRRRRDAARQPPARRLPTDAYRLQYGFRSGERVDAVIRVDKLLPVDAKFPLDNFERLADAETTTSACCTRRRSAAT